MKAQVFQNAALAERAPLHFNEVPDPAPRRGELLVKVLANGVCHTDLHIIEGDIQPKKLPLIPGHQILGEVVQLGDDPGGWQVGDRVGIPWLFDACGECEFCRRGEENLCTEARFTGFDVNGGYAELVVAKAAYALKIPAELASKDVPPLLCAGIIGYRSLRLADLGPGQRVGLVGFGASAHLAIQVALYWDCEIHVFTRSETHKEHARSLGATWVGSIKDESVESLDCAVIFAPAGDLVPNMLDRIRPGGTLAINAIHMSPIPSFSYDLIYGEKTLRSVSNATRRDGEEFLALAAEIPISPSIQTYSLEESNQALLDLKHSALNGSAVVVP